MRISVSPLLLLAASAGLISFARADAYRWDPSNSGAGGSNVAGAWNGSSTLWYDSSSSLGMQLYGNSLTDTVTFGRATAAAGVTVTVGTVNTGGITFAATTTPGFTLSGGTITFGGATPAITNNNTAFSTTLSSVLAGNAGLTFSGGGTTILTGANTYSGNTTVGAGSLTISGAGKLGAGAYAGAIALATGTTFTYGSTAAQTLSGVVSGAGAITKSGSGTLTLSGANTTYSGTTTINGGSGILAITDAAALGSGTVKNLATGALTGTLQLQLTGTNTIANSFTFSSTTSLVSSIAGGVAQIQNVSGNNTLSGTLSLTAASGNGINIQSDAGLLTLSGSVTGTAGASRSFTFGGAGDGLVTGVISDTGAATGVKKFGAGTWTFAGANTYTGGTSVGIDTAFGGAAQAGTVTGVLVAANAGATGVSGALGNAAAVTVFNQGTLRIGAGSTTAVGNIGVVTVNNGGTLDMRGGGASAITLTLAEGKTLTLNDGALLLFANTGSTISLTGAATVGAITLDLGNVFNVAGNYTLITGASSVTTGAYSVTGFDTSNYSQSFANGILSVTAVPEPSAYGLLGAGALAAASAVRLRRRTGKPGTGVTK